MIQQQPTSTQQTVPPITPIDPAQIAKHGESPTAIILAIAMLISMLLSSITKLVRAIMVTRSFR